MKKKDHSGFSSKASNLMAKWRKEINPKSDDQKQKIKSEPSSKEKVDKHKHSSSNGSSKSIQSSNAKKHSKGSDDKKKRHSEVSSEKLRNTEREEKKQKISMADYKSVKGTIKGEFDMFISNEESNDQQDSNEDNKNMYGLDDDYDNEDRYSPTSVVKSENVYQYNPSEISSNKNHEVTFIKSFKSI